MFENIFDSHTHSDNSPDGTHSVVYLCEQAIRKGISGIAVTDHFESQLCDEDHYELRIRQAGFDLLKAKSVFSKKLVITRGIELGQPLQAPDAAARILREQQFDFVLGSLHNLDDGQDIYYMDFSTGEYDVHEVMQRYFTELLQMSRWDGFDALAHLDYPLRYITGRHHIPVDLAQYDEMIQEILRNLANQGRGIEINTSGLRQPLGRTMPELSIIKRFRQLGGQIVTIGSDAHDIHALGQGIDQGMQMLQEAGFDYFAFYRARKPTMLKIV